MITLTYVIGPLLIQIGIVLALAIGASFIARKAAPLSGKRTALIVWTIAALAVFALIQQREKKAEYVWTQEVQLRDGSKIWIKRQTRFGHYGEAAQIDRAKPISDEMEFTHPKTGAVITWQGDGLGPLLLDFDQDVPYLAAIIKPGKHYAWGCPPHPYVFFKFENGQWMRIGIKKFPAKFVDANVLPYLSERTRKTVEMHGDSMRAEATQDEIRSWGSQETASIDRRIVNPLYFCQGSVDQSYAAGTTKRLQDRFGTNPAKDILTEQEAVEFGLDKGEGK